MFQGASFPRLQVMSAHLPLTLLHPPLVGWSPPAPNGSVSIWRVSPDSAGAEPWGHASPVVTPSSLPTELLNELLALRICSATVRPLPPSVTSASCFPVPEPHVPALIPGVTPSPPSQPSLAVVALQPRGPQGPVTVALGCSGSA